jgi:hypothetical protein
MKTPASNRHFTPARGQGHAFRLRLLVAALILIEGGCTTAPVRPFQPSATANADLAAQTRRFDGITKPAMLIACASLLQDLGFMIEEADSTLGVIAGSKNRTAEEQNTTGGVMLEATAKVAAFVALGMLTGHLPAGGTHDDPSDRQTIRVSLAVATVSSASPDRVLVSLTLNRVVYSRGNKEIKNESVHDPALARAFFEALSKSVFLEAHLP